MKRILSLILLFLLIIPTASLAATNLLRLTRFDNNDLAQIFLTVDLIPKYRHQTTGKRIDIFLLNTVPVKDIALPAGDQSIVKSLIDTKGETTILSFFMRYPPQKVSITETEDDKLVIEILTGNEYSEVYRDFTSKFGGLSVVQDDRMDYTNPLYSSPYVHNWASFITDYSSPVKINIPVAFTAPEFPIVSLFPPAENAPNPAEMIPAEIIEAGRNDLWDDVQSLTLSTIASEFDVEKKKLLALIYGEALLRQGKWEDAYKQFYLLAENYPDELLGFWSRYLLIYTTAKFNDPFLAAIKADEFAEQVPSVSNLSAYLHLLRIEIALSTGDAGKMQELLDNSNVAIPDNLFTIIELRQADLLWLSAKYVPAYAAYRITKDRFINAHPYSLNGYCDSLFRFKQYSDSATCYQELDNHVESTDTIGLIAYRHALSALRSAPPGEDLTDLFESVENTYPGTKASFLAAIKKNDHRYQLDTRWLTQGVKYYEALAENSSWKDVSEEAYLKEAVAYHLLGEPENSLPILMQLLREFRTGKLRTHTEALLLTLLPGEIKKLINEKEYIQAISLAKRNKIYFERNWIKGDVFPDLAKAYMESNLNQEAEKSYLYLYDLAPEDQKEEYFYPLIQSIFDQGKYYMVDDYASQYSYLYPDGKYKSDILDLRLHALMLLGKYEKALQLLPQELPEDTKTRKLVASVYFYTEHYEKSHSILSNIDEQELGNKEVLMLAESAFQIGKFNEASPLFEELIDKEYYSEQSMYRLAEIYKQEGNPEKSLKLYEKIVETGDGSLWAKYAERELRFLRITETIDKSLNR